MKLLHLGVAILSAGMMGPLILRYGVFGFAICLVGIAANLYFYNKEK